MSRTVKQEWSSPDGWHIGNRLARKARPAGRLNRVIEEQLEGICLRDRQVSCNQPSAGSTSAATDTDRVDSKARGVTRRVTTLKPTSKPF